MLARGSAARNRLARDHRPRRLTGGAGGEVPLGGPTCRRSLPLPLIDGPTTAAGPPAATAPREAPPKPAPGDPPGRDSGASGTSETGSRCSDPNARRQLIPTRQNHTPKYSKALPRNGIHRAAARPRPLSVEARQDSTISPHHASGLDRASRVFLAGPARAHVDVTRRKWSTAMGWKNVHGLRGTRSPPRAGYA